GGPGRRGPDGERRDPFDPELRPGRDRGARRGVGAQGGPLDRAADPRLLRAAQGGPGRGQGRSGRPRAGRHRSRAGGGTRGERLMAILVFGVSYRRAPVELLERLSFADDDLPKAYRRLAGMESVREAVILSTCNRIEVVAEVGSYHAGFLDLKRFLSE